MSKFLKNKTCVSLQIFNDDGKLLPFYRTEKNIISWSDIPGNYHFLDITGDLQAAIHQFWKDTKKQMVQALLFIEEDDPLQHRDIHVRLHIYFKTDHECSRDVVLFLGNLQKFYDLKKYFFTSDGALNEAMAMDKCIDFQIIQPHKRFVTPCPDNCSSVVDPKLIKFWLHEEIPVFKFLIRYYKNGNIIGDN